MKRNIGIAVVLIVAAVAIWITVTRDDSDTPKREKAAAGQPAKKQVTASMSVGKVLGVDPQFQVFADLFDSSKLDSELKDGPYTMFVPSSAAFNALPTDDLTQLKEDPTGAGAAALERHIVKGRLRLADLLELNGKTVETLGGQQLEVTFAEGAVSVGGVKLAKTDIETEDAEIHVIDSVLPAAPAG